MPFQGLRRGHCELITPQYALAHLPVAFAKDWPGLLFRIVGEKKPVAVSTGKIHRGVAPGLCRFRAAGTAGFQEGIPGAGQAQGGQAKLTAFTHTMQSGQVLAVLNGMAGTAQDLFHRVFSQGLQPQLLDLAQLLGIRVGGVILIVVIQAKQGEDLVDCLNMGGIRGSAFSAVVLCGGFFIAPRMCR